MSSEGCKLLLDQYYNCLNSNNNKDLNVCDQSLEVYKLCVKNNINPIKPVKSRLSDKYWDILKRSH